jgi:hypothetical protein
MGCVHSGFGLIGFNVHKVRGEDSLLEAFENQLCEFLGFYY